MKIPAPNRIDLRPVLGQRIHRSQKRLDELLATADIDQVHDFRVAARELLVCEPLLKALGPTRRWRRRLRKAHTSLNTLRDAQQMLVRIGGDHHLSNALHTHIQHLASRWQNDYPALIDAGFVLALQKSAAKLPDADPIPLLETWLSEWHITHHRLLHRLSKAQAPDLHSLHRVRICYKKWRYLLELLIEAGAPLPGQLPETMKAWQEKLGTIEDYRVMTKLANKLHGTPDCIHGFAGQASQHAETFMLQMPDFLQFIKLQEQTVNRFFKTV